MLLKRIMFSRHAIQRMFERRITASDVATVVRAGDIIEDYADDEPFPSALFFGKAHERAIHVVVALDSDTGTAYVVTCYWPDDEEWTDDFRRRRT